MSNPSPGRHPRDVGRSVRVLLVDDEREVRWPMAQYLSIHGFEVIEAHDGQSAIEAVRVGPPFGYLLTDLTLPDIDGRELVQSVRESSPTTRFAIVTGWSIEPDECRDWGVEHVFLKPVNLADVCRTLAEGAEPIGARS